jgi:DNA-binding MarR family transcriptional regulator
MSNDSRKVTRSIERTNQLVRRYLADHLDRQGITEIEAHLLARLSGKGSISVADLQRAFGLRPSTLTNALDRLERRRLIVRRTDQEDRRSVLVALTPAGRRAAREVIAMVDELESRVAGRVSKDQLRSFDAVVEAIEASLE